jgi:hypothetical protein
LAIVDEPDSDDTSMYDVKSLSERASPGGEKAAALTAN